MIIVSSREFRDKQALYFDRIDSGEEILVQRGKTKSYRIIPVTEFDTVIGGEYILKPDEDLARAISLEEFAESAKKHIRELYSQKDK